MNLKSLLYNQCLSIFFCSPIQSLSQQISLLLYYRGYLEKVSGICMKMLNFYLKSIYFLTKLSRSSIIFKAIDHLPAMTIFRKAMSSLEETRNPISLGINAQGHIIRLLDIHTQLRFVRIVAVIN